MTSSRASKRRKLLPDPFTERPNPSHGDCLRQKTIIAARPKPSRASLTVTLSCRTTVPRVSVRAASETSWSVATAQSAALFWPCMLRSESHRDVPHRPHTARAYSGGNLSAVRIAPLLYREIGTSGSVGRAPLGSGCARLLSRCSAGLETSAQGRERPDFLSVDAAW
jgi:hypothetical protein